jgi:2-dehydro-3-deoxyphosphogluconate aldolase/(4S)-4-hydroxy-2-oxoglutarate aldolase
MSAAMEVKQKAVESVLTRAPVIAVVVIEEARSAVAMARALVAGGIPAIEITLRTAAALDAIRAIAAEVEGATVGVGTVLRAADLAAAEKAGARFAVSPGTTPHLLDAAQHSALPLLPGAATASEAMYLLERGYRFAKCFPASAVGGAALLKALAAPLPQIRFCPTGGVTPHNAPEYLGLPNVACVGGSWLTPANLLREGRWGEVEALARAAAALRRT